MMQQGVLQEAEQINCPVVQLLNSASSGGNADCHSADGDKNSSGAAASLSKERLSPSRR